MKNDVLSKKDPFPKTVAEACHILTKWKNHYGWKYNKNKNESKDGIAFAMVTEENETKKSDKKKEITCLLDITPTNAKKNYPRQVTRDRALAYISTRKKVLMRNWDQLTNTSKQIRKISTRIITKIGTVMPRMMTRCLIMSPMKKMIFSVKMITRYLPLYKILHVT